MTVLANGRRQRTESKPTGDRSAPREGPRLGAHGARCAFDALRQDRSRRPRRRLDGDPRAPGCCDTHRTGTVWTAAVDSPDAACRRRRHMLVNTAVTSGAQTRGSGPRRFNLLCRPPSECWGPTGGLSDTPLCKPLLYLCRMVLSSTAPGHHKINGLRKIGARVAGAARVRVR